MWIAEVSGPDAFVSLAALAVNTRKAELATGVIPIQIRTPGAMAMGFLTINELSGGRAIAGLGVSSPIIVERWHGASYRKPVTAMRECVTIMRQLFTEGRSKFQGEVYKSDFKLEHAHHRAASAEDLSRGPERSRCSDWRAKLPTVS